MSKALSDAEQGVRLTDTRIKQITDTWLSLYPTKPTAVQEILARKPFIILPTRGNPFDRIVIPLTHQLQLWHPHGIHPDRANPLFVLRDEKDISDPAIFPSDTTVSYYARLDLTEDAAKQLDKLLEEKRKREKQFNELAQSELFQFTDSADDISARGRYGIPVQTLVMPSFYLRAFAALGNLLGQDYTDEAKAFVNKFDKDRNIALGITEDVTFADATKNFLSQSLDSSLGIFEDNKVLAKNDPIRIALFSISAALVEGDEEKPSSDSVNNQYGFLQLFKMYALSSCVVWNISESWSPSFAWQLELGTIQKFLVNASKFEESKFVLPVNVMKGRATSLNLGLAPESISHTYSIGDVRGFLERQPDVTNTLFAAANYGADWACSISPPGLSKLRNTASYKMETSGGTMYKGIYIDSPNAIADILTLGKVGDVKLFDLVLTDVTEINSLIDIATAVEEARSLTKGEAKSFKTMFGSILGDIRREICKAVAMYGLVFQSEGGYKWLGVDGDGTMRLKSAARFDGEAQSITLLHPPEKAPTAAEEQLTVEDQSTSDEASLTEASWNLRQDVTFLVQDGEGELLGTTSEISGIPGVGKIGILILMAAVRFGRISLDSSFTHPLLAERLAVSWVFNGKSIVVDSPLMYSSLFVLEDTVVVDHDGQGWIYGIDYLRGRDGAPGRLMTAETRGCTPVQIVEADFTLLDSVLVSP